MLIYWNVHLKKHQRMSKQHHHLHQLFNKVPRKFLQYHYQRSLMWIKCQSFFIHTHTHTYNRSLFFCCLSVFLFYNEKIRIYIKDKKKTHDVHRTAEQSTHEKIEFKKYQLNICSSMVFSY